MRIAVITTIVFLNFIFQSTLLSHFSLFYTIPNTALIIVVTYAMLRGDVEGAILGFCAGFLADIFFGRVIGVSALLLMFTGYFAGKPFRDFFKENYIAPIILVGIASLAYEFMFYVLNFLLMGRTDFVRYLGQIILPVTVYNLVICVFIYRAIYGINRALETREEKKRGFMKK
ncbi:MAG: rod shape-determining protein MreD [Defluviitaleaceae bacterium]|nr:rod shape-determining protein MreD [Defluviitaleaceae bacterium]